MRIFFVILLGALCLSASAKLSRDRGEVRAFQAEHPCPATGATRGACPGYQVDHTIPLCAGGPDKRENMFWLSVEDHRFKTFTDVRECRKLQRKAETPAK